MYWINNDQYIISYFSMALVQIQLVQENNGFLHRTLRFRFKIYGVLHRALRVLGGVKLVGNSGGICSTSIVDSTWIADEFRSMENP